MTKQNKRNQSTVSRHVDTGGGTYVNGDVHVHGGDFVGRDQGPGGDLPPLDLDSAEAEDTRARYRQALRERYNVIETHAFTALASDEQVGSPKRPPLLGEGGVYVPLSFDVSSAREMAEGIKEEQLRKMAERETGPRSLPQVLDGPGHLAIIGDAGSGKTTVLHVIAGALAAGEPACLAPDLAPVLPDPRPLPVLLPLRLFEHACASDDGHDYARCPDDLLRFVDEWFARWCPGANLPHGFLAAHIRAGRAWFLLDALDEVADPTHRQTVRNVIKELANQVGGAGGGTRLIVTARVAAYRAIGLDERFTVVTVRDLDDEQRARMVHAIYGGLALPDAGRRADDLAGRFAHSEALRDLARTPVMVWTAAVIHALRGELPESRAALYDAYVDILLKHSFKRTRYDTGAVDVLAGGEGWPLPDRRHYLTYAAFETHQLLETQPGRRPEAEGNRHIVVGEDELVDRVLGPYFRDNLGYQPREARRRARQFLTLMVERSGLLYETSEGYTIGDHLTMQEFLAGCYLGEHYAWEDRPGYEAFLAENVGRSWWREVFLLAAGFLAEKPGFAARQFLQQIAGQGEKSEDQLTALALAGRGLLQLRTRRRRPTWYVQLAQQFANRLYQMLYAQPAPAPAAVRHEAGLVLGRLYGYPGAGDLRDPRFTGPQGLPTFVPIEEGWFWMGSTEEEIQRLIEETERDWFKNELPRHKVYLGGYEIARYPTTNGMFARFIEEDGYADERWWTEAIQAGYWKDGQVKEWTGDWYHRPRYWDDAKWNNPSQPVVGVNWYEAVAYCRWLTATADDGHTYRLPTEAEWERAARGSTSPLPLTAGGIRGGATYPWGDDWRDDHCNSEETGLGVTTPVGIFPQGAAAGGIQDMAGNVYEWCRDWYGEDYYARAEDERNPTGPDQGNRRVLRGGSWFNDQSMCRCGFRSWVGPWLWDASRGFRCVRTSSS
jgi:formylglycine-generating enzyme required for sulfatase activity